VIPVGLDEPKGSTSSVEFFGQGCQAVQSGQVLTANKSCEQNICGTAAVSVETKPRVVMLLLDSSASRTECTDGSLDCLSLPGSSATRPPTYWETVQRAVESALVAPVVLVSDGGDNCSGATQAEVVRRLGVAAKKLHDVGVETFAIRYGSAAGQTPEQIEQLNAIANCRGGVRLRADPSRGPAVALPVRAAP
jgi:hypothetical protein